MMMNFIKKVISHKSTHDNIDAIHSCTKDFSDTFNSAFKYTKNYSFRDKPILVMSTHDTLDFDIIISGHIDVVPGSDYLFEIREDDDNLYGRGTYDMKAPLSAMVFGIMDYIKSNKNNTLKLCLVITADEELDGLSVKYVAEELGYSARFAIIPDGGSIDKVVVKQKGFWQFKINISGTSAHASRPWEAVNPFDNLQQIYSKLSSIFPNPKNEDDWVPSLSLTKVIGGNEVNTIPDSIDAYFDMRFVLESQKEDIEKIINSLDLGLRIEDIAYNTMLDIDVKENKSAEIFFNVLEEYLNKKVIHYKTPGTSDAVFFTEKGTPTILFRPIGGDIHTDTEWVNKKSLSDVRKISTIFLEKVQEYYLSIK